MGGLIQPSPATESERGMGRAVLIGVALVVLVVGLIALISREERKPPAMPDPYAANLKFSDLKMSAAENFVGATVTYLDGTVTNTGDKTAVHAVVEVTFKNSLGEVAQREEVPLHVLKTGGPYPDAVDLSASPLAPGQADRFRLTFEHVTSDWNQEYPQLRVIQVKVR
jgi:hypothetical protein